MKWERIGGEGGWMETAKTISGKRREGGRERRKYGRMDKGKVCKKRKKEERKKEG